MLKSFFRDSRRVFPWTEIRRLFIAFWVVQRCDIAAECNNIGGFAVPQIYGASGNYTGICRRGSISIQKSGGCLIFKSCSIIDAIVAYCNVGGIRENCQVRTLFISGNGSHFTGGRIAGMPGIYAENRV